MTQTAPPQRLRIPNDFDRSSVDLIREMEDLGWRGRNTVNGHVFMYAPDGEATCCVVPNVDAQWRTARNQLASYRRWLKAREAAQVSAQAAPVNPIRPAEPEPAPVAPEPVDTAPEVPRQVCGDCGRDFATLQALSVHHVRSHVRVACQFCGEPFSPGNVKRHEDGHRNDGRTPDDLRRALYLAQRELTRTRTERDEWQALAEDAERRMVDLKATVRAIVAE